MLRKLITGLMMLLPMAQGAALLDQVADNAEVISTGTAGENQGGSCWGG